LSRGARLVIILLFLLVILSLGLNGYIIWQLLTFRQQALALQQQAQDLQQAALDAVSRSIQELEALDEVTIRYTVNISEEIPVDVVVPLQDRMQIPVQGTIPISKEINTTLIIQLSEFGLTVPLDVTIPLALDVPVDITVPVDIDRQVPIHTTVPFKLDVPIVIRLSETELAQYVELLKSGLKDLEQALSGAGE